jgi:hypothetical protein
MVCCGSHGPHGSLDLSRTVSSWYSLIPAHSCPADPCRLGPHGIRYHHYSICCCCACVAAIPGARRTGRLPGVSGSARATSSTPARARCASAQGQRQQSVKRFGVCGGSDDAQLQMCQQAPCSPAQALHGACLAICNGIVARWQRHPRVRTPSTPPKAGGSRASLSHTTLCTPNSASWVGW